MNQESDDLVITATSDLFIATLLSAPKNEPILRSIINSVQLDSGQVPIKTATVLNPFNIKEFAVDKRIVLDVRVEDELNRIFCVEVQTTSHLAFVERIVCSWADTFSGQLHAGHHYDQLQPVISLVITEFSIIQHLVNNARRWGYHQASVPVEVLRRADQKVHLVFEPRERTFPEIVLSPCMQYHFLQLRELQLGHWEVLESVQSQELRRWLIFLAFGGLKEGKEMSQLVQNDPLVMQAQAELEHFSSDAEIRELERRHKLWKLEYYSGLHAAREEGREEGRTEGREEGRTEGREEGRAEEKAKDVIRLMQRFQGNVPESLAGKILEITNLQLLNQLFELACDGVSLEEIEKNIP